MTRVGTCEVQPVVGVTVPLEDIVYVTVVERSPTPSLPALPSFPVSPLSPLSP
ncbi:hypothetical protein ACI3SI_14260 [Lactococcus lactis]